MMIALTNGCRSWGNCHTADTTGLRAPDLFVEHLAVHADSASNGPRFGFRVETACGKIQRNTLMKGNTFGDWYRFTKLYHSRTILDHRHLRNSCRFGRYYFQSDHE